MTMTSSLSEVKDESKNKINLNPKAYWAIGNSHRRELNKLQFKAKIPWKRFK